MVLLLIYWRLCLVKPASFSTRFLLCVESRIG